MLGNENCFVLFFSKINCRGDRCWTGARPMKMEFTVDLCKIKFVPHIRVGNVCSIFTIEINNTQNMCSLGI